jgi:adenine-specific DNA methylase
LHLHQALRADYREALQNLDRSVSVVYADPPYTRDHYSRFYHVLETLCHRDDPEVSSVVLNGARTVSRGLYRESRHQSPFCIKSQAPSAFEALFRSVRERDIPLVVSYSPFAESTRARPRLMSIDKIKSLAVRYYRSVEIASAGRIAHSKLNTTELNTGITYDAEVLLVCLP